MRIAMTDFHLSWGGQALQVLQLAKGMKKAGHEVTVLAPPESELAARAERAGIETRTCCRFQRGFRPIKFWRDRCAFQRVLVEKQIQVVHCHGSQDNWLAAISRVLGEPDFALVRTKHNSYPVNPHHANNWLYGRAIDRIIAVSDEIRRDMINAGGAPTERCETINAGLDDDFGADIAEDSSAVIRKEFNIDPKAPLIGIVGRLEKIKGHENLLRAFVTVAKKHPAAKLMVVGTGGEYDNLKHLAAELGLADKVIFTLFRDDVARVTKTFDVSVMASEVEPWGLVVMEPMYLGVPVVATDSGGPTEITDKGRCGVLVPPNNPEEMAGGICRTIDALGTPKLEEQTASARKQIADNYLMSSVVAKTIATYEKAIARR